MKLGRLKTMGPLLGLAAVLQGCGGGSGSGGPGAIVSTVDTFPVDSVVTGLATKGATFLAFAGGQFGGNRSLLVEYVPVSPGKYTRRQTVVENGATSSVASSTVDFLASPFRISGWIDQALNPAADLTVTPLPVSAKVGTGTSMLFGSQLIQDNGLSTGDVGLTHGVRLQWTLAAHSPSTADLCLSQTINAPFISNTTLDCFEIDASGKILGFKGILQMHSKSIDSEVVYE